MSTASTAIASRTLEKAKKSSPTSAQICLESLPLQILMEILSYLDASALFTISHINKLFHQLANDNALWRKMCLAEFGKQRIGRHGLVLADTTDVMPPHGEAAGCWRRLYFKMRDSLDMRKCKRLLQPISPHTGLPVHTEQALRNLGVTWELTVTDKAGRENTLELSRAQFFQTSVSLCWSAGDSVPNYRHISTLELHGVKRTALSCPGLKTTGSRSLMAKADMQTLTRGAKVIGQDGLVELMLLQPDLAVAVWKGETSVAFILFTLHFEKLVARSTEGSSACPYMKPTVKPPFDDTDPEYGLHGYHLNVCLHNTVCELMSASFSQLFCLRSQISDGLIEFTAIKRTDLSQHTRLSHNISLPWRCEALQGNIQNCCVLSVTLLDEFREPFKCLSSPVFLEPLEASVSYDYDGEHYLIQYQDSDTRVKMNLVWMKDEQQFFLVTLIVSVSVSRVNQHFSRTY